MNSSRTRDSVILADSVVGCSGSDLGLPYTTAGTYYVVKMTVLERSEQRADFANWIYLSGKPIRLVL